MATAKQIEANRRNAQRSTEPRTEGGKAASRFNALRHGLRASELALPHEDPEEVQEFLDGLIGAIDPRDAVEAELAADIATLSWKLRRAERVDSAYLSKRMLSMVDRLKSDDPEETAWNIDLAAYDDDEAGRRRRRYIAGIRSSLSRTRRELDRWRAQHPEPEAMPEVENVPMVETVVGATDAVPEAVEAAPAVEATPAIEVEPAPGIGFVRPGGDVGYLDFSVGRVPEGQPPRSR